MNIKSPIPNITSAQSLYTKKLDLNDFYIEDRERQIIHCQICEYNVSKRDIFEHTVSKRHKYNKLFVAVVQNHSVNKDADFIVLNIDQLQCRYCDSLIINSDNNELVISHIADTTHVEKKQNCLRILDGLTDTVNNISESSPAVESSILQPLDSLIIHNKKYNKHRKRIRKEIVVKETVLLEEAELKLSMGKLQLTNTNNVVHQDSEFSAAYEVEKGENLPECIVVIEGPTCMCTICLREIPRSTHNVSEHLTGKKHKTIALKSVTTREESEIINMKQKLLTQPGGLPDYYEIDEKDSRTDNISERNVTQYFTFCGNSPVEITKEVSDYITIEKNGTRMCKVCLVEIPNTLCNIDEHVNGKKHKQETCKVRVPKQTMNISIPMTVGNTEKKHNKLMKEKKELQKFIESMCEELKFLETNKSMPESINKVEDDTYMCTTCVMMMSNNEYYIKHHNEGKMHKKELKKSIQPIGQKLEILNTKTSKANKQNGLCYMCITCIMTLSNNKFNIKQHNEGKNHKKALQKLIKSMHKELVSLETSTSMAKSILPHT